jgi:hypothetical protein
MEKITKQEAWTREEDGMEETETTEIDKGQRKRKTEKQRKGEHKKDDTKGRGGIKVLYWNVAGLSRKGEEFWEYIRKFEIVGLVETWVEERSWKKIEKTLPKDYKWKSQWAKREKKKGKATGRIITGVKFGIKEKSQERGEEEGCMGRNVYIGNE